MKKKNEERIIKVVQLRDPSMEISEAWLGKIDEEVDSDDGMFYCHFDALPTYFSLTNC